MVSLMQIEVTGDSDLTVEDSYGALKAVGVKGYDSQSREKVNVATY